MPTVMPAIHVSRPPRLLFNTFGNECASLIESKDWSSSSIGAMDDWPPALHITLGIILNSRFPMFIFWGPENLCFYNDAARFLTNEKHPFALGKKGEIIFAEKWYVLKPRIDRVLHYGETTWAQEEDIPMFCKADTDHCSTFSYSPIYNENGCRSGVLITGLETKHRLEIQNNKQRKISMHQPGKSAVLRFV